MIWRLAHPVRAMVTFVLAFLGQALVLTLVFGGFGFGLGELLVMALVATAAAFLANRESADSPRAL